jgi:hypothetical protein
MDWMAYALNMDDDNKKTFLQQTKLDVLLIGYQQNITELKNKIEESPNKDDIEKLKKIAMEYVLLKKEVNLAIYSISKIRSDNPDPATRIVTTVTMLFKTFLTSASNIVN